MATRIDYSVSVTPIQGTTFNDAAIEGIDSEVGRTLSASKSDSTWGDAAAGADDIAAWAAGVHVHVTSDGATITVAAGDDGLWVKNTGYAFDSSTTSKLGTTVTTSSTLLSVTGGSIGSGNLDLCKLQPGQGIFLPSPNITGDAAMVITLDDGGGDAHAVEYAILT